MEVSGYQSGRRKEKGQRAEDGRRAIFCHLLHSFYCTSFFFFLSLSLGRNKDNQVGLGTGGLQRAYRLGPTRGLVRRAYGG